ncbi:MAG: CBS domain-containing protein [Caldicoprobacterales bacterium]|nr:CBS domain-containing protein [Clostridiales bacterium]
MKVKDIMTTNVAALSPENTILDAAKSMQTHNIGCLPVCQTDGKVIGILTDRDIVVKNLANDGDPKTTMVKDVMTKNVITAELETDVETAAELMASNKIRRLPVLENGALVGMISIGDLATRHIFQNEAGQALGEISEPSRPMNMIQ